MCEKKWSGGPGSLDGEIGLWGANTDDIGGKKKAQGKKKARGRKRSRRKKKWDPCEKGGGGQKGGSPPNAQNVGSVGKNEEKKL